MPITDENDAANLELTPEELQAEQAFNSSLIKLMAKIDSYQKKLTVEHLAVGKKAPENLEDRAFLIELFSKQSPVIKSRLDKALSAAKNSIEEEKKLIVMLTELQVVYKKQLVTFTVVNLRNISQILAMVLNGDTLIVEANLTLRYIMQEYENILKINRNSETFPTKATQEFINLLSDIDADLVDNSNLYDNELRALLNGSIIQQRRNFLIIINGRSNLEKISRIGENIFANLVLLSKINEAAKKTYSPETQNLNASMKMYDKMLADLTTYWADESRPTSVSEAKKYNKLFFDYCCIECDLLDFAKDLLARVKDDLKLEQEKQRIFQAQIALEQKKLQEQEKRNRELAIEQQQLAKAEKERLKKQREKELQKERERIMALEQQERKAKEDAIIARNEKIKAEREQKEKLKHEARVEAIDFQKKVTADVKNLVTIPENIVIKNKKALEKFFEKDSVNYDDFVTLVERLGGEVDKKTGSSHHKVKFESEDQSKSSSVSTLQYAHGKSKDNRIRIWKLDLLKETILELLPENWKYLGEETAPKFRRT